MDYWIWGLQLGGVGTLMTGINFFVTILRLRAPGMTLMKMPIFSWTILVTNVLIMLAFPALTVVLALLALDRYTGMHFFTNHGGGNLMLFTNLFWIWGHPEVYIVILPAFGIYSELCSSKSAPGTASRTPVMPPIQKVTRKHRVHSTGVANSMRPR